MLLLELTIISQIIDALIKNGSHLFKFHIEKIVQFI